MAKPIWIIVHHSGGSDSNPMQDSSNFTFKQCEELHKNSFNFKSSLGFWTGYQYFIEKDGKIFQARKDDEAGAHTIGRNNDSIGICLAGNFDAADPTPAQIETLNKFLKEKTLQYGIKPENIVPHRKFAVKTCYGKRLPDDWARKLLSENTPPVTADKEAIKKEIRRLVDLL